MSVFYLGTHKAHWLASVNVPLFVSRRTLAPRKTLPRAISNWALDSGGFTEIHTYGRWEMSPADYADQVRRYADEIGKLDWAAPQDWMCEASALAASGLTVADHQRLTVDNFLELRQLLGMIVAPVLQGWELDDYQRCVDLFTAAGVDLGNEPVIGLGSVCRRGATDEISHIIHSLYPLNMHAFGVKGRAYAANYDLLTSADSMAWSFQARYDPPMDGCPHQHCNNCPKYALAWRQRMLDRCTQLRLDL